MSSAVSVGMQFGKWTVVDKAEARPRAGRVGQFIVYWSCECKCGRQDEVRQRSLLNGTSFRCVSCAAKSREPNRPTTIIQIDGEDHKPCPRCNRTLPLTEEFWYRQVGRKGGFGGYCKGCHDGFAKTPEAQASHKDASLRYTRKRQADNPEVVRAALRRWRRENPDKYRPLARHHANKRRAQENKTDSTLSASVNDIKELLANRTFCPLCRRKMVIDTANQYNPRSKQIDHIVPLNVGGTNVLSNLRVICRECNVSRPRDGSDFQGPVALWAVAL